MLAILGYLVLAIIACLAAAFWVSFYAEAAQRGKEPGRRPDLD